MHGKCAIRDLRHFYGGKLAPGEAENHTCFGANFDEGALFKWKHSDIITNDLELTETEEEEELKIIYLFISSNCSVEGECMGLRLYLRRAYIGHTL